MQFNYFALQFINLCTIIEIQYRFQSTDNPSRLKSLLYSLLALNTTLPIHLDGFCAVPGNWGTSDPVARRMRSRKCVIGTITKYARIHKHSLTPGQRVSDVGTENDLTSVIIVISIGRTHHQEGQG